MVCGSKAVKIVRVLGVEGSDNEVSRERKDVTLGYEILKQSHACQKTLSLISEGTQRKTNTTPTPPFRPVQSISSKT